MIYEVNLAVEATIATEFRDWLDGHVARMLAFDGFDGATVFSVVDPEPPPGRVALSVHYRVRDRAALNHYFNEHAADMRAEGSDRFGEAFTAARRVLCPA